MKELAVVPLSRSRKTEGVAVSYSHPSTCPPSCPQADNCYGKHGNVRLHWSKLAAGLWGETWERALDTISRLSPFIPFRGSVGGDLPGEGEDIDGDKLDALVSAADHLTSWTYTHKSPEHGDNAEHIARATFNGYTVNMSADDLPEADRLMALGIAPVVVIVEDRKDTSWRTFYTRDGHKVVHCPAETVRYVTCGTCGGERGPLCARADRDFIVGFSRKQGGSTLLKAG